jgi:hypothetical protein
MQQPLQQQAQHFQGLLELAGLPYATDTFFVCSFPYGAGQCILPWYGMYPYKAGHALVWVA